MEDMITAQPTIAWHRVLQDRRETFGLTRTWVSLLTGLSPTTIRRAEEDPDWTPTRDTVTALTHMWGEGWQDAGVQIVDPEAEQAAALERSLLRLHALTRPSTRRKAAALGHAETLTLALFGQPTPYVVLDGLLHSPERRPAREDGDALTWEEERELGFPERRYGEVVQRSGGLLQPLARAASTYAAIAQSPAPTSSEVAAALGAVWDCLDACEEDDLSDLWAELTLTQARAELRLHTLGWETLGALTATSSLTAPQQDYLDRFGESRPKLTGLLWAALDVEEEDAVWPRLAEQWKRDHACKPEVEDLCTAPVAFDPHLGWVSAGLPEDFVQELLGFTPDDAVLNEVFTAARQEIVARVATAAKWAVIEAGIEAHGWRRFLRKLVLLCRGGVDERGKEIRGAGLSPRMLAQRLDVRALFDAACQQRVAEQSLWRAIAEWLAHPFGPDPSTDASRLALAGLSLLPEPPLAERVLLPAVDAHRIVAELAPRFLDVPTVDRLLRFTKGAIRTHHGSLPVFAVEKQRREELVTGTRAALRGKGEESTAGKMARALLQTLPHRVVTGIALSDAECQRRLTLGLPYFFPVRRVSQDRLAVARSVVTHALRATRQ